MFGRYVCSSIRRFSHPSYSEAIRYIIFDKSRRRITRVGEILEKVILKVARYNYYDYNAAIIRIIIDNFDKMTNEVKKLFFKLNADADLAWIVESNFGKLPPNIYELLLKVVDDKEIALHIGSIVSNNFHKFPENIRNELLLKVADNEDVAGDVAKAVAENFEDFPENVRNELLLKVADNKEAASEVSKIVYNNFDEFPENVRNELLRRADKSIVDDFWP